MRTAAGERRSFVWDEEQRGLAIAVVGATGAVGRELCAILVAAGHPAARIDCRARRPGEIEAGGVELRVRAFDAASRDVPDLVFLCTPAEVSRTLAPQLAERGSIVVDLSSAHRLSPDVPLVVPEINAGELARGGRLFANPNCTAAIAALPLSVIERAAGLEEVVAVSFQAASGAGLAGLETLSDEMCAAAGLAPPPRAERRASPFAARLACNVIPAVAEPDASGTSGEERKVIDELRRLLARPDLSVEVTTTRVPVERCHSIALHVRTRREIDPGEVVALLRAAPGIEVTLDPHGPRPLECAGADLVHVGRIRAGTRGKRSLCCFAVGDQLRKGAALNAVQVAAAIPRGRRSTGR
jgi:aspartate-semialdehyde dehydrogenase